MSGHAVQNKSFVITYPAQPPDAGAEDAANWSKVHVLFLSTFQNWHRPPVEIQLSQHSPEEGSTRVTGFSVAVQSTSTADNTRSH